MKEEGVEEEGEEEDDDNDDDVDSKAFRLIHTEMFKSN